MPHKDNDFRLCSLFMDERKQNPLQRRDLLIVLIYSLLVFIPWLGSARSLTEHEIYLAGSAKQMAIEGEWIVPKIGDHVWLEKPVLSHWLIIVSAKVFGWNEFAARLPSALAGMGVAVIAAWLAGRWFGREIGILSGVVQATTVYTITYARLAESDMLLSLLVVGALATFVKATDSTADDQKGWRRLIGGRWVIVFWILVGMTNLVKGLLFGAGIVGVVIGAFLLWQRDGRAIARLFSPVGILLAIAIGGAWPVLVMGRDPSAAGLWREHLFGRASGEMEIYDEPWWYYAVTWTWQMLPWTPMVLVGAMQSICRAWKEQNRADRFIWCWAIVPVVLLSFSSGKHHHYLIHSLPALSIVAAMGIARTWRWLEDRKRLTPRGCRVGFAIIAGAFAIGSISIHLAILPGKDNSRFDSAFLRAANTLLPADSIVFATGGPEIARHIFYINQSVHGYWRTTDAMAHFPTRGEWFVFSRAGSKLELQSAGEIEIVSQSEQSRHEKSPDQRFTLFRVHPKAD